MVVHPPKYGTIGFDPWPIHHLSWLCSMAMTQESKLEVPTRYKAYVSGLCFRPMWWWLQYLQNGLNYYSTSILRSWNSHWYHDIMYNNNDTYYTHNLIHGFVDGFASIFPRVSTHTAGIQVDADLKAMLSKAAGSGWMLPALPWPGKSRELF